MVLIYISDKIVVFVKNAEIMEKRGVEVVMLIGLC